DELVVDVGDAELLDLGSDLFDEFLAAFLVYVGLEVGHGIAPCSFEVGLLLAPASAGCDCSAALTLTNLIPLQGPRAAGGSPMDSRVAGSRQVLRCRAQLHGNGLFDTGCSLPSAKREKRNGCSSSLSLPVTSSATSLPTPIIL